MKKFPLIIVLLFAYICPGICQASDTDRYVVARVQLIDTKSTGKRHNSFFFTFQVNEVLAGECTDSIVVSQEIYNDFGASAIHSKMFTAGDDEDPEEVVIHYVIHNAVHSEKISYRLIWVAEPDRIKSLRNLEDFLKNNCSDAEYNLLQEREGKLFFTENGTVKIAVETFMGSGNWIIATLDDNGR